ncbi:translocation/assembly module TamB domain-containing protein [Hydromonas duriensis]|uniref:Autotransporter secretion inner membrane protein TamB n=1 Tax=Hydromonas duriensis TaxID=1527608 RepID=A0A4R6YBQ7_9BURK|nr:translocation/assembly module TamB domain-containing protein [Hydromonas duriensis]TDR33096.1 autotransporter secretion inner membrane protein TamB [Hydromonas duriensis]
MRMLKNHGFWLKGPFILGHESGGEPLTSDILDAPSASTVSGENTPKPKKKTRWWRYVLMCVVLAHVLVIGAGIVMIQSESGTKKLWAIANTLTNGRIQADWNSGSLAKGGSASEINIHLAPSVHVDIRQLSGEWSWDVFPFRWNVAHLKANTIDVTLYPQPDDNTPLDKVTLPLALDVKRLQVNTVNLISGLDTTVLSDIDGALSTDGRHHQINLAQLTQGSAHYNGQVDIDGVRPFPIKSKLQATSEYEGHDYTIDVAATGDFYDLMIDLKASGGSQAQPLTGSAQLELQLLDNYYIHQGQINITHLNPYAFWDKLLKADLDITFVAARQAAEVKLKAGSANRQPAEGSWKVINHAPAPLSDFSLPIEQATGNFKLTTEQQDISQIDLLLSHNGRITGAGTWKDKQGDFKLAVKDFDLKNVHPKMMSTRLSGPLDLDITKGNQHILSTLNNSGGNNLQLFADVNINKERVEVKQARVSGQANAKIELQGQLKYTEGLPFEGKAQLLQFNLAELGAFPSSRLAGNFDVNGVIKPDVKLNIKGVLNDSVWAGVPAQGRVDVSYNAPDTLAARELDVAIGVNKFFAKGEMGISKDSPNKLAFNINAPNLSQLQFGFGGSLMAKGDLTGSLFHPRGVVDATATDLKIGAQAVRQAVLKGEWSSGAQAPMNVQLDVQGFGNDLIKLDTLNLNVAGTQASHQFNGKLQGRVLIVPEGKSTETVKDGKTLKLTGQPAVQWILNASAQGSGSLVETGWRGQINQFINQGQPNILLQHPAQVAFEQGELQFKNLDAQVQSARLSVESLNVMGARISSRGRINNLVIPEWLTWLNIKLPFYSDMSIKGEWDMAMGNSPTGGFRFEREKGDLWLDKRQKNTIALSQLVLDGRMAGRNLNLTGNLDSERLGKVNSSGYIGLVGSPSGWVITNTSPVNLTAQAQLNQLEQFNSLLGANIRLKGQMQADMRVGGTVGAPVVSGMLTGQNLDVLHVEQGFRLKDGVVRLKLTDTAVDFEQFDFNGVEGRLSVRGQASYGAGGRLLTAQVSMDKLRPFVRLDRQLVLSGQAELGYDGLNQLEIKGKIRVDRALIDMPPSLPPSLGDDVVVCAKDPAKSIKCDAKDKDSPESPSGIVPSVNLVVDLGDNFRFNGQGADVKLAGSLNLEGTNGSPLRAKGVVRITDGTYKFYGQILTVERGLITFQGPLDDPALNLYAARTISAAEVGVELTGTLADIRARLISTPEMPDEEKLSWLLFGRSSSNLSTGDGSAIAGAAAILLGSDKGRQITEKLGIDSFNFGSSENGLTGTVVGVGKRLSDQFSVSYEHGLNAVAGVVKITWNLSRHWQLLFRGGSINGADVQYSRRFDRL